MLHYLRIRQLAVIEDLTLEFSPGLNVLTGETGAGKSVVIDALALLGGAKRSRARPREGASAATIEAQVTPAPHVAARLAPILAHYDLPPLEEDLVLGRRLEASGRTRSYVQGRLVPRAVLADIGGLFVDICGQHESHQLRGSARQLEALDRFAGLEAKVAAHEVLYRDYRDVQDRQRALENKARDLAARKDFLEYQIGELNSCETVMNAYPVERARRDRLRDASELGEITQLVTETLRDGDDAVLGRLSWMSKRLQQVRADSAELVALQDSLATLEEAVDRAIDRAESLLADVSHEPEELSELEDRLAEAERLARKHRVEPDQLARVLSVLRAEFEEAEGIEGSLDSMRATVAGSRKRAERSAAALHKARTSAAERLSEVLRSEVEALCLVGAEVRVEVADAPLGPSGASSTELYFSANAGQPPAPLSRVASGGELSRLLLALRVASQSAPCVLSVFDEIDAGVGGHVAESIGRRLHEAARSGQVLCVTHWPQVAAFADGHFHVSKSQEGVACTSAARLDPAGRREELARMLGGARATAVRHAERLLGEARSVAAGPRAA